jgi:S-DNA-T family DNA segregation ATPase FtsK/SpoIIIE
MSTQQIIAQVAANHIQTLMDVREPHHLRIRGLAPSEITRLVTLLQLWTPQNSSSPPRLVVTVDKPWPDLPETCLLGLGETPTTARNGGRPVIFIEHAEYSDAQGLKNVRSITDQELLAEAERRAALVRAARAAGAPSTLLESALEDVYAAMGSAGNRTPPAVRLWADFVQAVVAATATIVDEVSAWSAIGDKLNRLELFPDSRLRGASATERVRLLRRNVEQTTRVFANSRESDIDDLLEKVQAVEFVELDQTSTPDDRAKALRCSLEKALRDTDRTQLRSVEFRYWEQVESRSSERKGLGQRLMEYLREKEPERAEELPEELIDGLDDGDATAAIDFLDLDPAELDQPRLSMLVDPKLRGALEKLADPPQTATRDPLRKLLAELHAHLRDVDEGIESLFLERRARKGADDELSSALFAWVYGPTLAALAETTRLQTDPMLLDARPLFEFIEKAEKSSDTEGELPEWADLRLQVRPEGKKGVAFSFEWRPRDVLGLIAFARVVALPKSTCWEGSEEASYDDWIRSAMEATPLRDPRTPAAPDELAPWLTARVEHLDALAKGLDPSLMSAYADHYTKFLEWVRAEHVPQGERDEVVAALIAQDCFTSDRGEVVMLPTHPIRQRWIALHFQEMRSLLAHCLDGELTLNPINDGALFFDHIDMVSPHAQPSVLARGDEQRIAVREQDWAEHFEVLQDQHASRSEWLSDLDDGAVDEIAAVVGQYVAAYPHKSDGLHLLLMVRQRGSRSLERLVEQVIKRLRRDIGEEPKLRLSLLVKPEEIREVERVLQRFDNPDHRAQFDFPSLHVSLHPWGNDGAAPSLDSISNEIDVAVVPNLFGAQTRTRESTVDSRSFRASFRPWLDEPTRIEPADVSGKQSTSVSRILLPGGQDTLLEAWSTLNTRHFRRRPVGSHPGPQDVDYFEQQVPFGESATFFGQLHTLAHWVVTVDAFVGREQVDALREAPDVILVKSGVGSSDGYRMVVSSKAGREFVVDRLQRRLSDQLPAEVGADHRALAAELYERARLLVPGIVLRSLGLGRTAAEMVGLVCARARVQESYVVDLHGDGFEAWISLDEHASWLGGVRRARADMARFVGTRVAEHLELEVLVVEAKMRKFVDLSRADEQLKRSADMLQAALSSDGAGYRDAPFWRREILRAIEQTSVRRGDRRAACRVHAEGAIQVSLDRRHRADLLKGGFTLKSVNGVLVTLADTGVVQDQKTPAGFDWLRLNTTELTELLRRLPDRTTYEDTPSAIVVVNPPAPEPDEPLRPEPTAVHASPTKRGGASRRALQRYQEVIDVLAEHGASVVSVEDEPAIEGPGFYVFRVGLQRGQKPSTVYKLSEELKLGLRLDAGHEPRVYADRGTVVIEIPKRSEERYYVDADDLWGRTDWPDDKLYAPLGVDVKDEVIGIEFSSSRSPHLLIGGMTGGGKSVALETLLWGLVKHYPPHRLKLWMVDPKGNEFVQFETAPHVRAPIGMDAEDAIEMLEQGVEEMERRYKLMKQASRNRGSRVADISAYNVLVDEGERLPWIVVVLDEFADLTAEKEARKTIEALLQRLAQKARACGIHCVVATQKPSAEVISTTTRSNLGAQLALRVRSGIDSRVIMETTGAESLAGNGDGFLRLSGEEPVRLQCAKT